MCSPQMGVAGVQAGGAILSGFGAYTSATGQKNAAKYQAHVSRLNASAAEVQANDAIVRGMSEMHRVHREGLAVMGKQQVAMAKNGLDLTEGSPLAILEDTAYFSAVDAATARNNSEKEAWMHRVRGMGYSAEAGMQDYLANSINPRFAGFTTAMTGATQAAATWYMMKGR